MDQSEGAALREACEQMADEAGPLRVVGYFFDPDSPKEIAAIRLMYSSADWLVSVGEESTIELHRRSDEPFAKWKAADASTHFPWAAAIGKEVRWAWVLENQQGYDDGLQLEFFEPEHGGSVNIQLIALNIEVQVHSVIAHETPLLAPPG